MIIDGKKVEPKKRNLVDDKCPVCNKNLRLIPPCCGQPYWMLKCPCGYKRIKEK